LKRSHIIIIGLLIIVAAALLFVFRVSEDRVTVMRMVDFEQAEPSSSFVWKDQKSIKTFEYAFRFGKKLDGKVDIAAPPFSVDLGGQRYWLWISNESEQANFMKPDDSGTLYRLSLASTKKIQVLLDQAYPGFASGELNSIGAESPMPEPVVPSPSNEEANTLANLDSSAFMDEEQPLIELINQRITAIHEGDWESFKELHTESKRKEYEDVTDFTGYTITSIQVEGDISIQEQRSLFQAVVQVTDARDGGGESRSTYVFHKGKEEGAQWRIADVD
jgi:hypothetical protein